MAYSFLDICEDVFTSTLSTRTHGIQLLLLSLPTLPTPSQVSQDPGDFHPAPLTPLSASAPLLHLPEARGPFLDVRAPSSRPQPPRIQAPTAPRQRETLSSLDQGPLPIPNPSEQQREHPLSLQNFPLPRPPQGPHGLARRPRGHFPKRRLLSPHSRQRLGPQPSRAGGGVLPHTGHSSQPPRPS